MLDASRHYFFLVKVHTVTLYPGDTKSQPATILGVEAENVVTHKYSSWKGRKTQMNLGETALRACVQFIFCGFA